MEGDNAVATHGILFGKGGRDSRGRVGGAMPGVLVADRLRVDAGRAVEDGQMQRHHAVAAGRIERQELGVMR